MRLAAAKFPNLSRAERAMLVFAQAGNIVDLPQMPGIDQGGYAGFTDQVNNHYLATFGAAAMMSLISAGQMVGQMAAFGGGGTYILDVFGKMSLCQAI